MSKIAVVLPTRNRPLKLERFIESVYSTCYNQDNVKIYLYTDLDDTVTNPKIQEISNKYPNKIGVVSGPRILMSQTANALLPYVKEDIFFLGADDLIFRTAGWDETLISFFDEHADKVVLAYGDDGFQPTLATHPILHRNWVESVGYLTPPYFESDYADTWINTMADIIGRKEKLSFVNEHMHYYAGKSEADSTFVENRGRYSFQDPTLVFNCLRPVLERDAARLSKKIEDIKNG
tara:strand:- start:5547 stop:6251 length:705 start_codon:yes stop_codon:yes gene_type:complete